MKLTCVKLYIKIKMKSLILTLINTLTKYQSPHNRPIECEENNGLLLPAELKRRKRTSRPVLKLNF